MIILGVSLKMYFGLHQTLAWCKEIGALASASDAVQEGLVQLFVLPCLPAVVPAIELLRDSRIRVGAQNVSEYDVGAFTGEVSGRMLAEAGCSLVEIGHAERRRIFGESDEVVAAKTCAAMRSGLQPIICVGEPRPVSAAAAAQHCTGELKVVLAQTLASRLTGPLIVAYEPIWAIGGQEPAPAEHISGVCAALKDRLAGHEAHATSSVIYGGSAGPGLLTRLGRSVDGLFLGRFAHNTNSFRKILDEAACLVRSSDR
jgi:triosephosphate isomerase